MATIQTFDSYRREVELDLDLIAHPNAWAMTIASVMSVLILAFGSAAILSSSGAERAGLFATVVGAAVVAIGVLVGQFQIYPESASIEEKGKTLRSLAEGAAQQAQTAKSVEDFVNPSRIRYLKSIRWLSYLQGVSIACNAFGALYLVLAAIWLLGTAK
jgi:hypothetical protein